MTARTRTENNNLTISGTRTPTATGVAVTRTALVGPNKKTEDHIGNFPNANSFKSESEDFDSLVLDGRTTGSTSHWVNFDRCPIQYQRTIPSPVSPISAGAPSFLQLNNWRGEILSRTNINKPGSNPAQFLGELKDLPRMIKGVQQTWSDIFRLAATGNISWRWFVAPFVSDLWKLLKFQDGVNRRFEDLKKLRVEREVKKRVKLGKFFASKTSNVIVNSQDMLITAQRTTVTRQHVWGSTSWKLAPGVVLPELNIDLHWRAFESYYGLNTYNGLRTLWELTPWSWFVDWFVDVSSFINAHDGTIPCNSFNTCIMRETVTRDTYSNFAGLDPMATLSGYMFGERATKERFVAPTGILLPTFLSPLVDDSKWLTLGSLFVIRNRSALGHDRMIRDFFRTYRGSGLPNFRTPKGRKLTRSQAEAREVSRLLGLGDSLGDILTRKSIDKFVGAAKSGRIKNVPTYLKTYYSPRYGWVN